ncbi:D-TA family PLP-dependent enzyme [Gordonia zhaorongruii]|uniref:D-TA family PLP-dependent enzyme n=1 Tax=Gordonia zhaorongruii TaxID=2597659 RepID=UPI00104AABFC|nr:D-TA family PLP-dependent enzyme [Gordonia zhaorongruii]
MGDMLTTPTVIVDEEILDRNIESMAASMRDRDVALRPHVKTHKTVEIARKQVDAGACGLTVATIGEAEVFSAAGFDDLFIAYPLWLTRTAAGRLVRLVVGEGARISFGVDSVAGAEHAAALLGEYAGSFGALIELDSGHHRSGALPEEVVGIARAAADAGLLVRGVFTFPGHSYAEGAGEQAADDEAQVLREASDSLTEAGFDDLERSGGSTPSVLLSDGTELTEARPGVYVFGDAQQWELGGIDASDIALSVLATVVSRHDGPEHRRVILDSGSKILGADRPAWASGFGRLLDYPDAWVSALSEHHATVVFPDDAPLPVLGSRIRVVPNHVCQVMNLVDRVAVTREGLVVGRWRVAARGQNS